MKQTSLFEVGQIETLTIEEVADAINVSTASVRNWIKTGYLEKYGHNSITVRSLDLFKSSILGKEKLNKRANKSLKSEHDHDELTELVMKAINDDSETEGSLSEIYENGLSESYK